jgi:hypothetical protein
VLQRFNHPEWEHEHSPNKFEYRFQRKIGQPERQHYKPNERQRKKSEYRRLLKNSGNKEVMDIIKAARLKNY